MTRGVGTLLVALLVRVRFGSKHWSSFPIQNSSTNCAEMMLPMAMSFFWLKRQFPTTKKWLSKKIAFYVSFYILPSYVCIVLKVSYAYVTQFPIFIVHAEDWPVSSRILFRLSRSLGAHK